MTYKQAIKYLNSFQNLEKQAFYNYNQAVKLKRFYKLCDIIGRPQDNFKSILIAGTKGKGSVCAILHSVLVEAGYRVGIYTSPHLLDLRERIKINKKPISKKEFSNLIEHVKESIKYAIPEDAPLYKTLTFFEIITAVSLLYFSKRKVDFAVIEVGLGGRLDATNVVYPLVSGIASISYDHTNLLGKTLAKIAKEKAGIIKENSFVISAPQKKEAAFIIKKVSRKKNNKLFIVGEDVKYNCSSISLNGTTFDYKGIYGNYKDIKLSLIGAHQAQNGAVALGILEILKNDFYFFVSKKSILKGFKKVNWPGRFEVLRKKPYIIVDGAHNRDSAEALKNTLIDVMGRKKIDSLILGCSSDKDIKGIGSVLCPLAKNVIFTSSTSPRATGAAVLSKLLYKNCNKSFVAQNPKEAVLIAQNLTPPNGVILATGSLFLVGDIMKIQNLKRKR